MSLSMMEAKLPPGFRFHPRDDELICDYLTPKIVSKSDHHHHHHHLANTINNKNNTNLDGYPILIDVDLNKCEPWDLPEIACVGGKEWYFFNLRDRKYATGQRTNRATMSGYWKATGKDRQVVRKGVLMGMRKTLVFYQGRAPKGKKTDWVMHEFRLDGRASLDVHPTFSYKEDWVLCRVFYKSRGAAEMTSKPTSSESCYDDTGSSSVPPPLTDNFIAFDRSFNQSNFTAPTSIEQVPCFSNYPQLTTATATAQSYIPLADMNKSFSKDLASSCYNPISLPQSCDQKIIKSVLDHFSKLESKRDGDVLPSSESYLSENGLSSSMWYPFQN